MYTVLGSVLGFRASFRSASPLPSAERRFSATAPVIARPTVISRARGAFSPQRGVKSHFPRSWRILRRPTANERSRSSLSIRAFRSARNARIRLLPNIVSKLTEFFPVQSRPLARLVQDDGSRKLPQIKVMFGATNGPRNDSESEPESAPQSTRI